MEGKHLSEVLKAKDVLSINNNRICILAGVGAGKNFFVKNELRGHGNIFFVTSRRATANEMLLDEICKESVDWTKFDDEILTTTNFGVEKLVKNQKFCTTGIKNLIEHYDIIVVDEFHSLNADATFSNASFHLYSFLNYISKNYPYIKIIVMTGTELPIKDILNRDKYHIIDKRKECINIVPKSIHVINRKEAIEIIHQLPEKQKTVYYTNSASGIFTKDKNKNSLYDSIYLKDTYNEKTVAFALSDSKANKIMTKKGIKYFKKGSNDFIKNRHTLKDVKEGDIHIVHLNRKNEWMKKYIVIHNKLPQWTKLLLTTSTLKEGINLRTNDIKIAFCESHVLSDIQQFAGRFRNGLDTLYVINDATQFVIDEKTKNNLFLYVFFYIKILDEINNFFNKEIKNPDSLIYKEGFGSFDNNFIYLFDSELYEDWSLYTLYDSAKVFIDLIEERFEYIRYNHLENKFELFVSAYREQMRIYEYFKRGWENQVSSYCSNKGINYQNFTNSKVIDVIIIVNKLDEVKGIKLLNEQREDLIQFLKEQFGLSSDRPQPRTFNKLFKKYGIPYELKKGITTGGRYIEVLPQTTSI